MKTILSTLIAFSFTASAAVTVQTEQIGTPRADWNAPAWDFKTIHKPSQSPASRGASITIVGRAEPSWLAEWLPANMKYLRDGVWHITDYCAGAMLSMAFIFFTLGRFSGSAILRFAPAHRVLGLYALANVVLMGLVFLSLGWVSVVALILSFFFMSIMYPTHFALAIRGLGKRTKLASSWMVTAIVGGAMMPMVMGWLADRYSMRVGFLMPMACFACIMVYGFAWRRLYSQDMEPED